MVTKHSSLLFNNSHLNILFPFHVLINKDFIIEACGKSMKKFSGDHTDKLFSTCFQLIRPCEEDLNFYTLCNLANQLLLLKALNGDSSAIIIKGEITYFEKEQKLLFTGTPWFNAVEELKTFKLMISDFPHNNPTVDLLHLLKTQEIINQDLNQLIITINGQKNKLKNGEEQILITLKKERELNQLKSNFISFASHEFKTPLACIRSSIELIQIILTEPLPQLPRTIKHLNNIELEVDQLSKLIDEVLIIGKQDSNIFSCKKVPTNLYAVIQNIINTITQIQDDKRSVTLIANDTSRLIMADPHLLNQIFNNIISNALKYSKGKKQPVVTIMYFKNEVQIIIQDFGIGIPSQQQAEIFQAFFRAENTNQIEGTGLGLFITKNFIELHGGSISFKSLPQKDTIFTVGLILD